MQLNPTTGWLPKSTFKAHITTPVTNVVTDTWTDFTGFTVVEEESLGGGIVLNDDNKTVSILHPGLYNFSGCIHVQNNTTGQITATLLSRILVNGKDEARCSQRGYTKDINSDGEDILTYSGSVFANEGDTLTLQYYTTNSSLEFYANSNFQEPVAATIVIGYYMEPTRD